VASWVCLGAAGGPEGRWGGGLGRGRAWLQGRDQAFLGWWGGLSGTGEGLVRSFLVADVWFCWSVQVVACTFQPPSWCRPRPSSRDRLTAATRKLNHNWLRVTPR
jgi:hypothetical protein